MAARTPIETHTPLANLEFVAFDTETTGCASATGRMVEIGAVRFRLDGTEVDRFTRLINPLRPIPRSVTAIHGITDAMVRDCPAEVDVLPEFLDFLGDATHTLLMAHNAPFDLGFVGAGLARCQLDAPPHAVLDTVKLSRRRAGGLPSHSLRTLVRIFGIAESTEHRGLSDSLALQQVFLNLVHRPPAPLTAGELFAYSPASRMRADAGTERTGGSSWRRRRWSRRSDRNPSFASQSFAFQSFATESLRAPEPRTEIDENDGDPTHQLAAAIAAGKVVSLIYDGGRTAGTRRRVTPLRLVDSSPTNYLLGWCHIDCKQKQYRLDRIRDLTVE